MAVKAGECLRNRSLGRRACRRRRDRRAAGADFLAENAVYELRLGFCARFVLLMR